MLTTCMGCTLDRHGRTLCLNVTRWQKGEVRGPERQLTVWGPTVLVPCILGGGSSVNALFPSPQTPLHWQGEKRAP